jgi:exosortase
MTNPLRIVASLCSSTLLNGLGCHVECIGTRIQSVGSDAIALEVADPCSGIRSLLALAALTSFYGSLTQRTLLKKWLLFLSALPLAVIGNIVRITSVGLISQAFGRRLAEFAHDYNGYIVFAVALSLMLVIGNFLNSDFHEVRERWRHALLNPTS